MGYVSLDLLIKSETLEDKLESALKVLNFISIYGGSSASIDDKHTTKASGKQCAEIARKALEMLK